MITKYNDLQKTLLDKYILTGLSVERVLHPIDAAIKFFHRFQEHSLFLDGFDTWQVVNHLTGSNIKAQYPGDCFYLSDDLTEPKSIEEAQQKVLERLLYIKANYPPCFISFCFTDREINDYVQSKS